MSVPQEHRLKPPLRAQILGADGEAADALAGRGENRVRDRGRDGRHARLAHSGKRLGAGHDVHFDHGHLIHAQHRVVVKIGLLHGAHLDGNGALERRGEAVDDGALRLRAHSVGIHSPPAIHGARHATHAEGAAGRNGNPGQLQITDPFNSENVQTCTYLYDDLARIGLPPGSTGKSVDCGATKWQDNYSYDDVNFTVTTTSSIDASKSIKQITAVDTLGRPNLSTTEDGSSTVYSKVSAQYDLFGRPYSTSNPYTGSSGSYFTTTAFDVLGRPTSATLPDTSKTTYSYATKTATVTDPTGKQRKSQSDAAGRLAIAFEPDPANGNALTLQTSYIYNVFDELTQVTQGSQTRTYAYDALGRLNSATTPEAGRVCFGTVTGSTCNADGYDSFDNLLKRTDARGVLTTYGYDTLNRLTSVSYNVGATGVPATATVNLTFGATPAQFNNGRLITTTDGPGSENYTYNNLGQMTQLQKVISGTTYTTSYAYNLSSELTQITYPSGRAVTQSVDAIGRLSSISGTLNSVNTTYASGFAYNAAGQMTGFGYGNGLCAGFGFTSDRLQLSSLSYFTPSTSGNCQSTPSQTLFNLSYAYGAAGSNNGQISGITDSVDSGRSATYTYDSLYRLSTAATTGSTGYPQWGLSMAYDRYGNRTDQNQTVGNPPMNHVTIDATTNRINYTGYAYDASGNMTNDGSNALTYDAQNHLLTSTGGGGSGTYTYDGKGIRVKKVSGSTTTVYVFSGSKVIAEYVNGAALTAPTREYVYSSSQMIAKIEAGVTNYYHSDHLSARVTSDSSGNKVGEQAHFPFGESWYSANTTTKFQFTNYERDAESGNDYAMARYTISRLGRFSSPDPVGGSPSDPQSLNRYAYVRNDPINSIDPLGLFIGNPPPPLIRLEMALLSVLILVSWEGAELKVILRGELVWTTRTRSGLRRRKLRLWTMLITQTARLSCRRMESTRRPYKRSSGMRRLGMGRDPPLVCLTQVFSIPRIPRINRQR